jgi:hypothetical protein
LNFTRSGNQVAESDDFKSKFEVCEGGAAVGNDLAAGRGVPRGGSTARRKPLRDKSALRGAYSSVSNTDVPSGGVKCKPPAILAADAGILTRNGLTQILEVGSTRLTNGGRALNRRGARLT